MLKQPLISVIVPIYNVSRYIKKCACSLFEQTLENIEYIFVDDCSPDNSMEVLNSVIRNYPERKPLIKVIRHEINKGLPSARNSGLSIATGKYIIHCDSDDWVEKNMYEELYHTALLTNADIIGCDFYEEYPKRVIYHKQPYSTNNQECIKDSLIGKLHCTVCTKLIKKELYDRSRVQFPSGINMWEDVVTSIQLYYYANKIAYLPEAYYHYIRYNVNSYTNALNYKSCWDLINAVEILDDFFHSKSVSQEFEIPFNHLKLSVKLNLLLNSRGKQQQEWNKLYPQAKSCILSDKELHWYRKLSLLFASNGCLLGFNLLSNIGKMLKHNVR